MYAAGLGWHAAEIERLTRAPIVSKETIAQFEAAWGSIAEGVRSATAAFAALATSEPWKTAIKAARRSRRPQRASRHALPRRVKRRRRKRS
jgi:hypothetical protein